ncbi:MAG: hypothetical protein IJO43_02485 [Bacilli bacterium]|nr:hypothetical protein [Bacilli bacterium]
MKKKKNIIILSMVMSVLVMAVVFAALQTRLSINGVSTITSTWKVEITSITSEAFGDAYLLESPVYSSTNATINTGLKKPGDKMVYSITVANSGTVNAIIEDVSIDTSGSAYIIYDVEGIESQTRLEAGKTVTFSISVEFDSNATSIPSENSKEINMNIITIQDDGQQLTPSNPNINQNLLLTTKILKNNIVYADNVASTYVSSETGIDFSQASSDTNGKGLYYTSTNTEGNKKTYYFRGAVDNNYVQFGKGLVQREACMYNGVELTHYDGKSSVDNDSGNCAYVCQLSDGKLVTGGYFPDWFCTDNLGGTYMSGSASIELVDVETDILWRIIRINEDGSVRLITENITSTSKFNNYDHDNAYVGYMYGTPGSTSYKETHKNTNDSQIKTNLDNWYMMFMGSYSSYLADAGFCNDRSIAPSAGMWSSYDTALGYGTNETNYGAYNRLYNTNQPQFVCPQKNDLFTLTTSGKGNKKLRFPIGLITIDEVVYAGGKLITEGTENHYLVNFDYWWTMSAAAYGGGDTRNWYYYDDADGNNHIYNSYTTDAFGIRPVINLRGDVEVVNEDADGTIDNPYIIKTN